MNSPRFTPPNRADIPRRGFSMIELIAVIVVVSILAVVAVGVSKRTYQNRQRAAARQLVADAMYARELAITTARNTWIKFDITGNQCLYYQTATGAAKTAAAATAITDAATGTQMATVLGSSSFNQFYVNVALGTVGGSATSPQWVGFDWLGRATDSSGALLTSALDITVTTTSGDYSAITYSIQPETGLTTVTNMPAN